MKYFADRGHKIVPSSPLIPHDDPTLLFTNSGMVQFKGVFLGLEKRDYKTATSSQKCLRAGGKHNDLENVGFTARHNTFFEMLGNFSFGDYFKQEAIAYAWEYVTKTLGLDPKRLYATVFNEDDDGERLWRKIAPELGDRILRFDEKDNFWSMGDTGPCGPCSEIHYDRGDKYSGELNGEGDRFAEIWNLVFMQYDRDDSGKLTPLPKPSIDTGAGLERFSMVLHDAETNYETDLFLPIIRKVEEISRVSYEDESKIVSFRVIADHLRALCFAIADGGIISNEGSGYVLRRILRRAARHGRLLDMHEPFLYRLVGTLSEIMGDHYTEVRSKQKHIELVLRTEEEQFGRTLDTGLEIFEDLVEKVESSGSKVIPGTDIFRLYDTFGFPPDLTEVMARERGLAVDMEGFERELAKQRERSRQQLFSAGGITYDDRIEITDGQLPRFIGYDNEEAETRVLTYDDTKMAIEECPFYSESGGQVGDTGIVEGGDSLFVVENTIKRGDVITLFGHFKKEPPKDRPLYIQKVVALVDHARRADIKRNHTATHLLHKALRMVLGEHVHQSGSLVAPDRLRFDFTHFKAMTAEEIDRVEEIVRAKIKEDLPVKWEYKSLDEAKKMGAMALFGEKYADRVRVVITGRAEDPFSMELCGGTHVDHTADIGEFYITQETAIAAGTRRIEAVTGRGAKEYIAEQEKAIGEMDIFVGKGADMLSSGEAAAFNELLSRANNRLLAQRGLSEKFEEFAGEVKKAQKEREKEKAKELSKSASEISPAAVLDNEKLYIYRVPAGNVGDVMVYSDRYKKIHNGSSVVTISDENGNFAITTPDDSVGQAILGAMKSIPGVRGGGRPTVRGSLPVEKIDSIIEILTEKFGGEK